MRECDRRIFMIFAKVINEGLEVLKKELKSTKDAKWYRRLQIVQLSSQKRTVPQLAMDFDLCEATVRDYIRRYNESGFEALKRGNSNGRPTKINMTKAEWEELLHRSPCQFEKLNTGARNWTQKLLVQYCSVYLDVQITQSAISGILKRLGIKWNRGKLKVTSPDPLYTVKRERIETLKKKAKAGTLIMMPLIQTKVYPQNQVIWCSLTLLTCIGVPMLAMAMLPKGSR
jgi:transposase